MLAPNEELQEVIIRVLNKIVKSGNSKYLEHLLHRTRQLGDSLHIDDLHLLEAYGLQLPAEEGKPTFPKFVAQVIIQQIVIVDNKATTKDIQERDFSEEIESMSCT